MTEKYLVILYKQDGIFYRRIGECRSNDSGFADWPALEKRHKECTENLKSRIYHLEQTVAAGRRLATQAHDAILRGADDADILELLSFAYGPTSNADLNAGTH